MKKFLLLLLLVSCTRENTQKHLEDVVLENKEKDLATQRRPARPRTGMGTILVDFDGQYVSNTLWNTNGPIDAQPSGLRNGQINQIMSMVKAMNIFDSLYITTNERDYFKAPYDKRTRVIVTASYEWYSNSVGGVAYINSWSWGDDTPCFVFNTLYNNDLPYVAHAIFHEGCHTIGLRHHSDYVDCIKVNEYHWGCVIGQYGGGVSVFDVGPNSLGCNVIVDEKEFIRSKL